MKRIDVHCHFYPESYLQELEKHGINRTVGIPLSTVKWESAKARIEQQDRSGTDMEVMAVSTPNVYFDDKELSLALAQMSNDALSEICRKYPDRFGSLASIPLVDMKYALDELDRCIDRLGMDGVCLGTNINGKPLESDEFLPIFEAINSKRVPVFLHPMHPRIAQFIEEYQMVSMLGFPFETTMTVVKMVLSGLFEKYPDMRMVLPHAGGTIPFLHGRIEQSFQDYEPARKAIGKTGKLPSDYLKNLYFDTAISFEAALRCTYQLVGAGHMLFGTDHPYTKQSPALNRSRTIEIIENSGFSEEEKEQIFSKNIMTLIPRLQKA
jgi:predicted TIM-barrel fold metal-dependent hydrolase